MRVEGKSLVNTVRFDASIVGTSTMEAIFRAPGFAHLYHVKRNFNVLPSLSVN